MTRRRAAGKREIAGSPKFAVRVMLGNPQLD